MPKPIIKDKISFVESVATMVGVDMGIQNDLFPKQRPQAGKFIEYDTAVVEGVVLEYNDFKNSSKAIRKDGKDTVRLAPINLNNHIEKEELDADVVKFGQNQYGNGKVNPLVQSALDGIGKHYANAEVTTKSVIYEVLETFKIKNGFQGKEGVEDIVFPVPAENIQVLDNSTNKYWNGAGAKPLTDIKRVYDSMLVKPSRITMSGETYSYFYNSDEVNTIDNTTTGTKRNFIENENIGEGVEYYRAGKIVFMGMILDVYVESASKKLQDGTRVPFMTGGIVSFSSKGGSTTEFGGITKATDDGVSRNPMEFDVDEVINQDPPQHKLVFRTAPLPCIKDGNRFATLTVYM